MLKKINRLRYMDYLIRIQGTGNLAEFASKINTSRSTCGEYLRLMRELGGKIRFNRYKNSYYYTESSDFIIGYKDFTIEQSNRIKGGFTGLLKNSRRFNKAGVGVRFFRTHRT